MGWNLPPGCRDCDLPGFRPQDIELQAWMEFSERNGIDPDDAEELERWKNDRD